MTQERKNAEIRMENKYLIEHARGHVEHIQGSIADIRKTNAFINKKGVHLTYKLLGTCRGKLTNCFRNELESSSVSWALNEDDKNRCEKGNKVTKSCYKKWNKFMNWLRLKKVKVIEDFKDACEWKWQHDEN